MRRSNRSQDACKVLFIMKYLCLQMLRILCFHAVSLWLFYYALMPGEVWNKLGIEQIGDQGLKGDDDNSVLFSSSCFLVLNA